MTNILGAAGATVAAVLVLRQFAPRLGLIDHPGGRKEHAAPVPVIGGLAILAALLAGAATGLWPRESDVLLLCLVLLAFVGAWDDARDLRPRIKFAAQILAAGLMIEGAGVVLLSVGDLLGWRPIGLSHLAAPLTVFAVVGVVNAINMIDGQDGLAGLVCLQAFLWYALAASGAGMQVQAATSLFLAATLAGFLLFNLRLPWQPRAHAFLGDAGSLMLGFALAWMAVDLTQGSGRPLSPIAALWIVLLPLADCVSLMARRIRAGHSPFLADKRHIHQYLLARGFSVSQCTWTLAAVSSAFGAIGYAGSMLGVPDPVLFWPFFFGFIAYHRWIQRAWDNLG